MNRHVPDIVLSPHFEPGTETVIQERHGGEWQPKYLHILTVAFVATFLTANILAFKVAEIWGIQFGAAAALFPFSLLVGDTLSEVYGFKRTRNAVFVSLAAYGFFVGMAHLTIALPAAAEWKFQTEYEMFYATTLRVFIGASLAFLVSQILNAYVIVKIKAVTHGRHFYVRALAATIVSELAHTLVVAPIMFASILTFDKLFHLVFVSTGVKILVELAALPFTYVLILKLKKDEGVDFYAREREHAKSLRGRPGAHAGARASRSSCKRG